MGQLKGWRWGALRDELRAVVGRKKVGERTVFAVTGDSQ
jgi:hypothetical protein